MRNYQTARSLFSFLEFLAWAMVVLGGIAALMLANSVSSYAPPGAGILAALPGVAFGFLGVLSAAMVQNWRAGVDSAEYSQQMLKIARDQLELSRQTLKQGETKLEGFANKVAGSEHSFQSNTPSFSGKTKLPEELETTSSKPDQAIEYRGKSIVPFGTAYHYAGIPFKTVEKAKEYIDQLGVNPNTKIDGVTRK